jgi:hypothetical protein
LRLRLLQLRRLLWCRRYNILVIIIVRFHGRPLTRLGDRRHLCEGKAGRERG